MYIQYLQLTGGALLQYPTLLSELLFSVWAFLLSSDCTSTVKVIFGSFVSDRAACQGGVSLHYKHIGAYFSRSAHTLLRAWVESPSSSSTSSFTSSSWFQYESDMWYSLKRPVGVSRGGLLSVTHEHLNKLTAFSLHSPPPHTHTHVYLLPDSGLQAVWVSHHTGGWKSREAVGKV